VFGPAPDQAVDLARKVEAKDEIFRRTGSVVAVDDVAFEVPERQVFVVMGLSGSGKSTLIRCLNRLFEPTRGTIHSDDTEITGLDKERLRRLRARPKSLRGISSAYDRPPARSRARPDAGASGKLGDKAGADRKPTGGELGSGTCFVVGSPTMLQHRRRTNSSHLLTAKLMKGLVNFSDRL